MIMDKYFFNFKEFNFGLFLTIFLAAIMWTLSIDAIWLDFNKIKIGLCFLISLAAPRRLSILLVSMLRELSYQF